ncbi:MAG: 3-hydroxyacyl-CoA dehydrogenase family protein, partial [Deltaproteobacteria bacterium]|nr:3-hydroxyacyl-CoA dehydrogenase family protein [Deltaproteobacteria bacterium]
LAPAGAILASNTSLLRISDIGKAVKDRKRLVVAHWFNPPYLIPVVEVVRGPETSPETWEQTIDLLKKVGKTPIRVLKEVPGHLVNRIQFALLRETLSLLQDGVAEVEEIDQAVSGSLGLRLAAIGPLRGMDLSGLEIFWYGMENMHQYRYESPDPRRIIEEKIKAGHVGRKAGRGFYTYEPGSLLGREEVARDRKIMELLAVLHPRSGPVDS